MYACLSERKSEAFAVVYKSTPSQLIAEEVLYVPSEEQANQPVQFDDWLKSTETDSLRKSFGDERLVWNKTPDTFRVWKAACWSSRNKQCTKQIYDEHTENLHREKTYCGFLKYNLACHIENGQIKLFRGMTSRTISADAVTAIESFFSADRFFTHVYIHTGVDKHLAFSLFNWVDSGIDYLSNLSEIDDYLWAIELGQEMAEYLNVDWINRTDDSRVA